MTIGPNPRVLLHNKKSNYVRQVFFVKSINFVCLPLTFQQAFWKQGAPEILSWPKAQTSLLDLVDVKESA